jgi:hypothetical protein
MADVSSSIGHESARLSPLREGFFARRPIESLASKRTARHVWPHLFGDGLLTIRPTFQRLALTAIVMICRGSLTEFEKFNSSRRAPTLGRVFTNADCERRDQRSP